MDRSEICIDPLPRDLFEWVNDMDAAANKVDISKEEAAWNKPSIYRVTSFARSHNPNAFTPQVISFGPFHHGSELLKATEEAKHRALTHFFHRSAKGSEPFVRRLRSILKQLQDSYQGLDEKWIKEPYEFLKMMLLDGCFMIEVLRMNEDSYDYATNDPVFSSRMKHLRKPYIKRDMLLLENQLPLLVLKALLEVESCRSIDDNYINNLVLSYCTDRETLKANLSRLASHPLELYRMSRLNRLNPSSSYVADQVPNLNLIKYSMIENAVELRESGVRFRANYNCKSLMDINFDHNTGKLKLPVLPVHDGTEYLLLNMVAYEQIHVGASNEITSYVMFMDALIKTKDDVKLLQGKKIITNSIGSHKHVAELFNRLPKEAAYDPNDALNKVRSDLSEYHKNKRHRWLANLQHEYLPGPWKVISIVAGSLVILLTFIQALYSVLTFHLRK